ncbi:MAG: DUF4346 domain-containing protein [Prochlorococcus sp.]|jgi:dihydropteroate synthase|nr:DUF4346 domain-containing protein [Prochlorococcaceae cyanobacterium Fu_MAG_134]|tara:strand:+ start:4924 stop:5325 length:402 start_codon:yes stop_codon:yes gene_type:complete
MVESIIQLTATSDEIRAVDDQLSQRFIALDPSGYFLIRIDASVGEIVVEHFLNDVDERGRAIDPATGEIIACRGGARTPATVYRGRTAKQVGIQLTEGQGPHPLSRLDHALYMGRELQRAENCLLAGKPYIQD